MEKASHTNHGVQWRRPFRWPPENTGEGPSGDSLSGDSLSGPNSLRVSIQDSLSGPDSPDSLSGPDSPDSLSGPDSQSLGLGIPLSGVPIQGGPRRGWSPDLGQLGTEVAYEEACKQEESCKQRLRIEACKQRLRDNQQQLRQQRQQLDEESFFVLAARRKRLREKQEEARQQEQCRKRVEKGVAGIQLRRPDSPFRTGPYGPFALAPESTPLSQQSSAGNLPEMVLVEPVGRGGAKRAIPGENIEAASPRLTQLRWLTLTQLKWLTLMQLKWRIATL